MIILPMLQCTSMYSAIMTFFTFLFYRIIMAERLLNSRVNYPIKATLIGMQQCVEIDMHGFTTNLVLPGSLLE